jgi:hypothetical protein
MIFFDLTNPAKAGSAAVIFITLSTIGKIPQDLWMSVRFATINI